MRAKALLGVVAAVLVLGLAGCGGDEGATDPAACDGLEAWAQQIGDLSDQPMGEGFTESVAEMSRLEDEWRSAAPDRIRELYNELDELDSESLKIDEQERREEVLAELNTWVREDCGLDVEI